ncbi:MAG: YkgJ family cysteine cluster protein [Thermodesulfobacteriota bacterium]
MSFALKKRLLRAVYDLYDREVRRFPAACRKDCSACCTRNVLATTLEAAYAREELTEVRLQELYKLIPPDSQENRLQPKLTVNELAGYCLRKDEPPPEYSLRHSAPCPFRNADGCAIYEVRPFACRSMWSTRVCADDGEAEMPALLVTLNGVFFQVLEHLDTGGLYGNLLDLLEFLGNSDVGIAYGSGEELDATASLLNTQPNPGFIVPPEHRREIALVIGTLWAHDVGGISFREALSRLRPGR